MRPLAPAGDRAGAVTVMGGQGVACLSVQEVRIDHQQTLHDSGRLDTSHLAQN